MLTNITAGAIILFQCRPCHLVDSCSQKFRWGVSDMFGGGSSPPPHHRRCPAKNLNRQPTQLSLCGLSPLFFHGGGVVMAQHKRKEETAENVINVTDKGTVPADGDENEKKSPLVTKVSRGG